MKFLLIPLGYQNPAQFADMLSAFNKHGEAVIYNGNADDAIAFKPDVVFYQGSLTKDDCIKIKVNTGAWWTTWTGDVRYAPVESLTECIEFTDQYYLPFTGELLNIYRKLLKRPCSFIWEPFQNWRFREPKELTDGKTTFVGNLYDCVPGGEERIELERFLKQYFNYVEFRGSMSTAIPVEEVPALYNDSYLVIAENNWQDIPDYFTPRNLTAMSAGSCCLAKVFPGIENYFENWKHCIYYRHKYELLDIISYLKKNPQVRNEIAWNGHELMKKEYTFDKWVFQYINKLYLFDDDL